MKPFLPLLLFLFLSTVGIGQTTPGKIIKSIHQQSTNGTSIYYQKDEQGNTLFSKNDGMNGALTTVYAYEYDSLGRETRNYNAHSNIGCSILESVYQGNQIDVYRYPIGYRQPMINRTRLNKIQSKEEFLNLEVIQSLQKEKKQLYWSEWRDSNHNILETIFFDEAGDTLHSHLYRYNQNQKKIAFQYYTPENPIWNWTIFYEYDQAIRLVKSYRLSSRGNRQDTSDVYHYYYNDQGLKRLETRSNRGRIERKTEYTYDAKGQLTQEAFYDDDLSSPDLITTYEYDNWGNISTFFRQRFRESGEIEEEIITLSYEFWED